MKKHLLFIFLLIHFGLNAQQLDWAVFNGDSTGVHSITQDLAGNLIVTGIFIGTKDFDPGNGVYNLTSLGIGYNLYIQKLTPNGNLIWVKNIERGSTVTVKTDQLNNIVITGPYSGTYDFDPGPNIFNLSSNGAAWDTYVLKLDYAGNFLWAISYGSFGTEHSKDLTIDLQNNIYITGFFNDTMDIDPGINSYNLLSNGLRDIYIQKLDPGGNFVWGGSIGSADADEGTSISFDASGFIYVAGQVGDYLFPADFDLGPGVYNAPNGGAFILKLDLNGNFVWVKVIENTTNPFGITWIYKIEVQNNFIYVGGWFEGTVDFDPGPAVYNLTPVAGLDWYILKLDTAGNFLWGHDFGSIGTSEFQEKLSSIAIDTDNNVYSTGFYSYTVDFDPGPGIYNLTSNGSTDFYIHKLDSNGNFVWVHTFGGTATDQGLDLLIDDNNNLYIAGKFDGTIDFDPGPNNYSINSSGAFFLKWFQDSCSIFSLVVDSVSDVNCTSNGFASSYAQNGLMPYTFSWNTIPPLADSILTTGISGIYTLVVNDANGCTRSSSVLINGPSQSVFDLNVNGVFPEFRPGFTSTINLDVYNNNCDTLSGQIILVLDSLVNYVSSTITPDLISGDSLIWNYSNLYYSAGHFTNAVNVTTNASLGDLVCFKIIALPVTGDQNPLNNSKEYCYTVIGSYDPNDKKVYPEGVCDQGYVLNNETLTYTIRFQNTGTADAINVYILDTLNNSLDINSVKIAGKSHEPMITEILDGNILKFRFDDIYLPDSTTNEPASHGYVIYEIKPLSGINNGSVVNNSASIFFDYNSPIITNSVSNIFVTTIPSINTQVTQNGNTLIANLAGANYLWLDCNNNFTPIANETNQSFSPVVNGSYAVVITESGCSDTSNCFVLTVGIEEYYNQKFIIYPNPANETIFIKSETAIGDVKILDVVGKLVYFKNFTGNIAEMKLQDINPGIYFIEINRYRAKIIKY